MRDTVCHTMLVHAQDVFLLGANPCIYLSARSVCVCVSLQGLIYFDISTAGIERIFEGTPFWPYESVFGSLMRQRDLNKISTT